MPKFSVTIAATVRAYAVIEIDAADEDAASQRAGAVALLGWSAPEMKDVVFDPAWDSLDDFEALEDVVKEEV